MVRYRSDKKYRARIQEAKKGYWKYKRIIIKNYERKQAKKAIGPVKKSTKH